MKTHNVVVLVVALLLIGGALLGHYAPGVWPAFGPVVQTPAISVAPSGSSVAVPSGPLRAESGWTASLLTDNVPGARDMALDQFGNVWVSQTSRGTVSTIELKDAAPDVQPKVTTILKGLRNPHGLAFDPVRLTDLYVAQETSIGRLPTYSDGSMTTIADLPAGGRHFTRSLAFGPDERLYVSIGSTCDVCREKNSEHGSIISMTKDGTGRRIEASGVRNAVFITFVPDGSQKLLTMTDMGRDYLGDKLPPDDVDQFVPDGVIHNFGWPICYGNRIHDTQFDKNVYIRDPCADTIPPIIELPAHVAPLGLAALKDGSLLVAYHGSWNSSVPVGYKVVRWSRDSSGWKSVDFLTGFLAGSSAIGRPVDVLPMPDGSVLVSDDKKGAIWRVSPTR